MERQRKDAKRLLRAVGRGDAAALERAERVLGPRLRERFVLSDAQHVLAVESGYRTWAELLRAQPHEEVVATGVEYFESEPVRVRVRRRGRRSFVTDSGRAAALAGLRRGWRERAERLVERELCLNVSRDGHVFVTVVEGSGDVDELVRRVATASKALYQELLELG